MRKIELNGKICAALHILYQFLSLEDEKDEELMNIIFKNHEKRVKVQQNLFDENKEEVEKVEEYAHRIQQKLEDS
jgi:hypothetical protein